MSDFELCGDKVGLMLTYLLTLGMYNQFNYGRFGVLISF